MFYMSLADGAKGVVAFREKRTPESNSSAAKGMPPFSEDWLQASQRR